MPHHSASAAAAAVTPNPIPTVAVAIAPDLRGWAPLIALEIPYNLIERTVERDLIPMAATMGLGVICWSPLATGVLTGKYSRSDLAPGPEGTASSRKEVAAGNGFLPHARR